MISRFAVQVKRNGQRVIDFLFGWYKIAAVLGLSYGLILWIISLLFPDLRQILIQIGLAVGVVAVGAIIALPLFWTVFRNRIARKKSLNPNIALLTDCVRLYFRADELVEYERELIIRALVSGISHVQFHVSWAGKESDVSLVSAEGAEVSIHSPTNIAGLRLTLNFGRALLKGRHRRHRVKFKLLFVDNEHLIKSFNGFTSVYAAEEELTLGYSVEGATDTRFLRSCFPSLSSETPVVYEEHVELGNSHEWRIDFPVHGFRYSLACLSHGR